MNDKQNFLLTVMAIMLMLAFVFGFYMSLSSIKETEAKVVSIEDCVVLVDTNGDTWVWELEAKESIKVGQQVVIQYSTNRTIDAYDDEIVEVKLIG